MISTKTLLPWAICGGLWAAAPVQAQALNEGLQACRAKGDPQLRLACYDAIPLAPPAPSRPAPHSAAPAPAAEAPASNGFGFEAKTAQALQQSIDSHIEGRFDGWGPKSRIRLANGQVWQVVDDSNAVVSLDSPKVQIRRGAMGAFYIEFERSNRTARVRRLE